MIYPLANREKQEKCVSLTYFGETSEQIARLLSENEDVHIATTNCQAFFSTQRIKLIKLDAPSTLDTNNISDRFNFKNKTQLWLHIVIASQNFKILNYFIVVINLRASISWDRWKFSGRQGLKEINFLSTSSEQDDADYKVENWKFHFVPGTAMGLFMALALPLSGPYKNVYLAYNFEGNYKVPGNETTFEYPPLLTRSIDRKFIYTALETKMRSSGYSGKPCLLRTICELSSSHSILHANGILGDILHVIFTPSTSTNLGLEGDYEMAEKVGKQKKDCSKYSKNCSTSFLDLITWFNKAT